MEHGIDVNLRDKDGTSAAFRAQVNGHENVVSAICETGDEDELMNIYERVDGIGSGKAPMVPNPNDVYAVPNKGKHAKGGIPRSMSLGGEAAPPPTVSDDPKYTQTLPAHNRMPKHVRLESIRNVIQSVMNEDDYMKPEGATDDLPGCHDPLEGIGRNTLRGVLREELDRYRQQLYPKEALATVVPVKKTFGDGTYEDLYASIGQFGPAPIPPDTPGSQSQSAPVVGPPLPPRNTPLPPTTILPVASHDNNGVPTQLGQVFQLHASESSNAALTESFKTLAPRLGSDWKKLAAELPIESSKSKTTDRIKAIERKFPGDQAKQATAALVEWSMNKRQDADVDNLILGVKEM